MTPEFPRPFRLDAIGSTPRKVEIAATETERRALARRFGLIAINRLEARAILSATAAGVSAAGELNAEATQACVASGEPLAVAMTEPFAIRFVAPESSGPLEGEEIELEAGELDVVEHDGAAIDLGEAVAQSFALALDPFPRAPDAEEKLRAAGVLDESATGPFAALKALRDRMG